MKVTTVRLPESLHESLEAEAADEEMSVAEYIRAVLRNRQEHTPANTTGASAGEYAEEYDDLRDRVAELEARVEDLESLNQQSGAGRGSLLVNDETAASEGREAPSSAAQPPGSDTQDVVAFVRENGPVSRSEIIAAFREEWQAEGIKGDSWWRRTGREALDAAGAAYTRNRGWEIKE